MKIGEIMAAAGLSVLLIGYPCLAGERDSITGRQQNRIPLIQFAEDPTTGSTDTQIQLRLVDEDDDDDDWDDFDEFDEDRDWDEYYYGAPPPYRYAGPPPYRYYGYRGYYPYSNRRYPPPRYYPYRYYNENQLGDLFGDIYHLFQH